MMNWVRGCLGSRCAVIGDFWYDSNQWKCHQAVKVEVYFLCVLSTTATTADGTGIDEWWRFMGLPSLETACNVFIERPSRNEAATEILKCVEDDGAGFSWENTSEEGNERRPANEKWCWVDVDLMEKVCMLTEFGSVRAGASGGWVWRELNLKISCVGWNWRRLWWPYGKFVSVALLNGEGAADWKTKEKRIGGAVLDWCGVWLELWKLQSSEERREWCWFEIINWSTGEQQFISAPVYQLIKQEAGLKECSSQRNHCDIKTSKHNSKW